MPENDDSKIQIILVSKRLKRPIDASIMEKTIELLNRVFNSTEFRDLVIDNSFTCSNKPSLCGTDQTISGQAVYDDLMRIDHIELKLHIKKLWNPFKRYGYHTKGETNINGNTIITYNWWLKNKSEKERLIIYASHVGHEIFHTKYYQYIHNPKKGSRDFVEEKDVTYNIDNIIEQIIRTYIN